MILVAQIINTLSQVYVLIIILSVLLSYFMDPYHPVRQGVDRLVNPLLDPLRRFVPPLGMMDFSPVVLIVLIQLVSKFFIQILIAIS